MSRITGRSVAESARLLLGAVYVGGAAVHVVNWVSNRALYGEITPYILFDWYRELWSGLVLPNLGVLLPVLAVFELAVGVAVLQRGRLARVGLGLGALFNLALAPLGFWWPSNVALAVGHLALLRLDYRERSLVLVGRLVPGRA